MDRHVDCRTGVKPVVGGLRSRYTFFLHNHSDRRWFSRPWNVIPCGLEPHQKPIKSDSSLSLVRHVLVGGGVVWVSTDRMMLLFQYQQWRSASWLDRLHVVGRPSAHWPRNFLVVHDWLPAFSYRFSAISLSLSLALRPAFFTRLSAVGVSGAEWTDVVTCYWYAEFCELTSGNEISKLNKSNLLLLDSDTRSASTLLMDVSIMLKYT